MNIITEVYPFDEVAETPGHPAYRRWAGSVTFERDLTTQVITATLSATKLEGPSTSGLYFYWDPAVPYELRPELAHYPYTADASFAAFEDGLGYIYISGDVVGYSFTQDFKYVSADPVHPPEAEPGDSVIQEINSLIELVGVPVFPGYAATGASLPYVVTRPLMVDNTTELALNGDAVDWDFNIAVYCCAAGVEASFNLALAVIGTLQGARVRGTTLAASMGYNGAEVEGHYESQVTVQLNQGGF